MRNLIITFFIIVAAGFVYAGNEVGNGGDVIVCKSKTSKIDSVELLDFYEARIQEKIEMSTAQNSTPPLAQLKTILEKVKRHSPKLAKQYKNRTDTFFKEVSFLEDARLKDIDDSAHLILPRKKECSIKQIAIFKKAHKSKKNFLIDKNLWDKMDSTNKAGLILHEIIYEHLSYLGEKNSIKVRQINSLFFSKNIGTMTTKSYWKRFQDIKVPIYRETM